MLFRAEPGADRIAGRSVTNRDDAAGADEDVELAELDVATALVPP
jgi:hypothetical protein